MADPKRPVARVPPRKSDAALLMRPTGNRPKNRPKYVAAQAGAPTGVASGIDTVRHKGGRSKTEAESSDTLSKTPDVDNDEDDPIIESNTAESLPRPKNAAPGISHIGPGYASGSVNIESQPVFASRSGRNQQATLDKGRIDSVPATFHQHSLPLAQRPGLMKAKQYDTAITVVEMLTAVPTSPGIERRIPVTAPAVPASAPHVLPAVPSILPVAPPAPSASATTSLSIAANSIAQNNDTEVQFQELHPSNTSDSTEEDQAAAPDGKPNAVNVLDAKDSGATEGREWNRDVSNVAESAYRTAPKEKTKGSEAIFSDRQKDNREGFLSTNKSSASLGAKPSAVDAGDNLLRAKESRESAELSAEPEAPMKGTRAQKPFKYMSLLKPKSHAKKPKTISETANSKTALSTAHRQDLGELNSRALDDDKKIDIQAHTAANTATKNLDEVIDESLTTQNTASSTTIPADLWTSRHLPDTPQAKSLPPVASKAGKLNPPSSPNTNNKIESVLNIVADVKSPLPPAPKLNNTSEGENGLHSVVETTTTKSESKPDAERAVAQIAQLMNDGALRNEMDWKIESPAVKAGPEASATNPADLKLAASLQSELSPPDNLDVNMEDSDSSVSGLHQFNKGKGKGKEMEPEAEVAEDSMDLTTEDRIPSISLPIGVSDSPERPLNAEGSSSSAESDGPRNLFASSQLMDIDTDTVELERKPPTSSSLPGLCRSFERFSVSNPTSTTPSPLTPMPTTTSSTSSNPTKKGTSAPTHKPEYAHNLKDDVPQRAPQPTTAMAHGLKKSSEVKPQESRTLTDEICEYHLCTGTIIKFVKCKELHPMANSVSMHAESAPFIWVRISSNGSEGKLVANAASALEGATSSAASKSNLQASTSKVTRPPLTNTYLSANPATQAETLGVVSSGEKSSSTVTSEQKRSDSLLLTSNTASNPAQDQDQAAMKTAQAATGQESEKKDPMTATVSVQTISSVKRDSASQSPQPLPHLTYRGYLPPTDMALLRIAAAVTSSEACPAAGGLPAKPIFKVQGQSFTFHPADLPNISIPMDAPGNISRHVKPPHDLISRTYNPFIPPLLPFSSKSMVSNTSSDVGKLVEPPHRFRPRATSPSPKQKIMTAILEKRRCHSVRKRRILHGKGEGLKRHINVHTTELHLDIDCEIPDPVLRRQAFKPAEPRRDENVVQSQPVPSELRETPQTPIGDLGFTAERRLANDFNDITNSKKHSNNAEAEIRVASEPIVRLTSELAAESASKPSLQSTRKHLVELDSSAPVSNNQTSHHVEKEVELHEEITENGCSLKRKYPTAFPGSSCSLRSDPSNPLGNLFYPHLMADRPFGTDLTPHKTHNWGNNPNTEGSRPHGQMSGNTPGKQTEASKEISDHPGHSFGKGTAGTSGYCTVESPHHLDGGVDLHGDAWDQGNRCRCTACTTNREGIYGLRDAVITHLKTCWPAYLCAALLLPSPSISWML